MSDQQTTEARAHDAAERVKAAVAALNRAIEDGARLGVRTDLSTYRLQMLGAADFDQVQARLWVSA